MYIDPEAEAAAIRREARADEAAGVVTLALRLLGAEALVLRSRLRQPARYCHETQQIHLRTGLTSPGEQYYVAHELAERHLTVGGWRDDGSPRDEICDAIAAALVAPRRAVAAALRAVGLAPEPLAAALGTSQTIAVCRVGEVTGRPVAAVLPGRVIVRGEPIEWGHDDQVRRLARGELPATLERIAITDAPRRVALTLSDRYLPPPPPCHPVNTRRRGALCP